MQQPNLPESTIQEEGIVLVLESEASGNRKWKRKNAVSLAVPSGS
jgi:hypothetical protein